MDHFEEISYGAQQRLRESTAKATGKHRISGRTKTLLDLDNADDLSILDGKVSKMNDFQEVLRVQGARRSLKVLKLQEGV